MRSVIKLIINSKPIFQLLSVIEKFWVFILNLPSASPKFFLSYSFKQNLNFKVKCITNHPKWTIIIKKYAAYINIWVIWHWVESGDETSNTAKYWMFHHHYFVITRLVKITRIEAFEESWKVVVIAIFRRETSAFFSLDVALNVFSGINYLE